MISNLYINTAICRLDNYINQILVGLLVSNFEANCADQSKDRVHLFTMTIATALAIATHTTYSKASVWDCSKFQLTRFVRRLSLTRNVRAVKSSKFLDSRGVYFFAFAKYSPSSDHGSPIRHVAFFF